MGKREEVLKKKRDRLTYLEDRALPKARHYMDKAEQEMEEATRFFKNWSSSHDEIMGEIEELETEIELLEEVPEGFSRGESKAVSAKSNRTPAIESWEDHTGNSAWEATSGYEL